MTGVVVVVVVAKEVEALRTEPVLLDGLAWLEKQSKS